MANAILRLIEDAALSEKLVDNGLAEVEKYTWQHVWPVLAAVYDKHARRLPPEESGMGLYTAARRQRAFPATGKAEETRHRGHSQRDGRFAMVASRTHRSAATGTTAPVDKPC